MPVHPFDPPRGTLETFTIRTPELNNLLGDPIERTVAVYLPEGYADDDRAYPLFVDLAPFTGSGLKRIAWTAFGASVPQRLDRLVAAGEMGPVIAVFPDAFTSLGGNQYVDSVALGAWGTFVSRTLVAEIERRYRVLPGARHRAVYGRSSGGYGALVAAMRHPGTWGAVACHSGDMAFDLLYRRDLPALLDTLAAHGGVEGFLAAVRDAPRVKGEAFMALMLLAMAASYAPDPSAPYGIRLPVDPHTCELDEAVWAQWLAHDPVHMVDRPELRTQLAELSCLFIDCGSRDPYFLHYGARQLCRKLERHGIDFTYEEFPDGHSGLDYRLDVSLPRLYAAVAGG